MSARVLHPELAQLADDVHRIVRDVGAPSSRQVARASFLPAPEAGGLSARERRELHLAAERIADGGAS